MNKALSFLCFFIFCLQNLMSQVITGIVTDRGTDDILPYVNIAFEGSHFGTISRTDGTYELDLEEAPEELDSITFSMLGYVDKTRSVPSLIENGNVELLPAAVNLESVIVSPRSPEEYIQMAIDRIPENYIDQPFNGTIYYRTMIRLNGLYIESSESIIKGYIMPTVGTSKDSTRLKMLAYKYYDQQSLALRSVKRKKKRKKKDDYVIEGLDTMLIGLADQMSEYFGIYTQLDSNLIKLLSAEGYEPGKEKVWYEHMVQKEDRNLMKIGYKMDMKMAKQHGHVMLDEESLAFDNYGMLIKSNNLKIKMALMLMGIGFKKAEIVIQGSSLPSGDKWIPDLMRVNAFIDMEKNRWFAKDIPIRLEITSSMKFLDVENPPTDLCQDGRLIKKKVPLRDQFKSDPENPLWDQYSQSIAQKKFTERPNTKR